MWRGVQFSAHEKIPFSARNHSGAPSAQDLGCFSALEAVGIPFCAGKDTFFCLESFRGTFRAGFRAFFCPGGGWLSILRRKRYLFLPGMPPWHLPRRNWCVFLLGRRWVSRSAPEMMPFSAWNASEAPSAQELVCFSAREAVGIPFRAGNDTFFCPNPLRGSFCAGRWGKKTGQRKCEFPCPRFFMGCGVWRYAGNAKKAAANAKIA